MNRCTVRRNQHGFSMVEVLFALSMLVIFLFLAGRLFSSTVKLSAQSQVNQNQSSATDSALNHLRRDVWISRNILLDEDNTVHLQTSSTSNIIWKLGTDNLWIRTDEAGQRTQWPGNSVSCGVYLQQASLTLHESVDPVGVQLVSQYLLQKRGRP